jgi:glycosyltransferase involved in cell wall biosynthesis
MKRKVFFIVSSLGMGGSEKVFWLLAQGFDKNVYDIYIIVFDSRKNFLSSQIPNVKVIDLKTIKASRSFFKLYKLIRKEKPFAVFSTAAHLNLLVASISFFIKIPKIIARESNIFTEMAEFGGYKTKILGLFVSFFYDKFDAIVCQSDEMHASFIKTFSIDPEKLIVIPNPVLISGIRRKINTPDNNKRIVIVARLSPEKAHNRLVNIFSKLPENYHLTIAGDGVCKDEIMAQINSLGMQERVSMIGQISNVNEIMAMHDVVALASLTEGFPNAILESLTTGTPVVAFRVGGIDNLIKPGFNGYIVEQGDLEGFGKSIIKACSKLWDTDSIRNDAEARFSLQSISTAYASLIN